MDNIGEFDGISDEEYGQVVTYYVVITFPGIEFDRKPSGVACRFGRSLGVNNCRNSHKYRGVLTLLLEEFCTGILTDIAVGFKIAIGTCSPGMHHPFWSSFTIEMGQFLYELVVLKKSWPSFTSREGALVIIYGGTLVSG